MLFFLGYFVCEHWEDQQQQSETFCGNCKWSGRTLHSAVHCLGGQPTAWSIYRVTLILFWGPTQPWCSLLPALYSSILHLTFLKGHPLSVKFTAHWWYIQHWGNYYNHFKRVPKSWDSRMLALRVWILWHCCVNSLKMWLSQSHTLNRDEYNTPA